MNKIPYENTVFKIDCDFSPIPALDAKTAESLFPPIISGQSATEREQQSEIYCLNRQLLRTIILLESLTSLERLTKDMHQVGISLKEELTLREDVAQLLSHLHVIGRLFGETAEGRLVLGLVKRQIQTHQTRLEFSIPISGNLVQFTFDR